MSTKQLAAHVTAADSTTGRATEFERASRGQLGAANIEPALERNRAFAAARGHEGAVVFPNLRLFVITCLDPRVDPPHFLGLGLSDAMVLRNVCGRVTPEVINDLAFIGPNPQSLQRTLSHPPKHSAFRLRAADTVVATLRAATGTAARSGWCRRSSSSCSRPRHCRLRDGDCFRFRC